jgi:hypothetical protein
MAQDRKEAAMDRWLALSPIARHGLLVCSLLVVAVAAWAAGLAWLAVGAALGVLGSAAAAIGADSREPGDWRPTGS